MFVRLKPYNPKKGYVLQRYLLGDFHFLAGVWKTVDDATAAYLRTVTQITDDPDTHLAFDVAANEAERDLIDAGGTPAQPAKPAVLPPASEDAPIPEAEDVAPTRGIRPRRSMGGA